MIMPFNNSVAILYNNSQENRSQTRYQKFLQCLRFLGNWENFIRRLQFFPALCLLLFITVQSVGAASPAPGEVGELWQGKVLTASFRAGMCFDANGKARGVLLLRHRNGQQDAYHLYGSIRDNEFNLTHSSGHQFTGRLTGPEKMEGSVRLANGMKLNLEGSRIQNAILAGDDCSPPAQ